MSAKEERNNDTARWRLWLIGGVLLFPFLIIAIRLGMLQFVEDEEYTQTAKSQSRRLVIVPAPRGNIYDRNGTLLVGNRPSHNIVADVSALQDEINTEFTHLRDNDRALRRLTEILDSDRPKSSDEIRAMRDRQSRRNTELRVSAASNVLQRYLDRANRILGRHDTVDAAEVEKKITRNSRTRIIPFTLVRDLSEEELARFVEHFPVEYPIRIATESVRTYPHGTAAAHVLGYLRNDVDPPAPPDNPEDDPEVADFLKQSKNLLGVNMLKKYNGQRAVADINSVEFRFEKEVLEGTPGYQLWTVRPNGYVFEKIAEALPQQGGHLFLSLDIDLQRAAENSLAQRFSHLRSAAVAIDVKTGEVLVCANAPSFDPARANQLKYRKEFEDSGGTWLNIATQFGLHPGSSFKPITAIAALRNGDITPDEELYCEAFFDVDGRLFPEHTRRPYGWVNLVRMLQVSCNVYCYQAGLRVGIDKLAAEAKRFGLDSPSTLEISPARASTLIVPTPEFKRRRGLGGWVRGDTANTAIGQGFLQTTPLHLASMFASIARNETRTAVTIIHDPARASVPRLNHHGESIGLTPHQYQELVRGLVACASPGGTGQSVAGHGNYPGTKRLENLTIASKTGTAQFRNNTANMAWVLAYAPVEDPRIAVAVMIEGKPGDTNFGGGANAGPVANAILAEWQKKYQEKQ